MVEPMALDFSEHDGQTPLDPDETAGLIPQHLANKGDLNDWEQENILHAVRWLMRSRSPHILGEGFCRELHQQMFGKAWEWAGTFRRSDRNIGRDWTQIAVRLSTATATTQRELCASLGDTQCLLRTMKTVASILVLSLKSSGAGRYSEAERKRLSLVSPSKVDILSNRWKDCLSDRIRTCAQHQKCSARRQVVHLIGKD